MTEIINHGYGIVTFKNAHKVNFAEMQDRLIRLEQEAIKSNFTIVYDESGKPIHAVNQGGFIYGLDEVHRAPLRLQALGDDWYNEYEAVLYGCLMEYIEIFPALLPCLWWKSVGHILSYSAGGSLGLHCDNDVNYRYGNVPDEQHATRNVVSAIIFLNTAGIDFEGGSMYFPYADIEITPTAGDAVFFPANYTAAHQINEVTEGKRYSYLAWFAQGPEHPTHGINPQAAAGPNGGQVWLQSVVGDYDKHVIAKYGEKASPPHLIAHRSRSNDHHRAQ